MDWGWLTFFFFLQPNVRDGVLVTAADDQRVNFREVEKGCISNGGLVAKAHVMSVVPQRGANAASVMVFWLTQS